MLSSLLWRCLQCDQEAWFTPGQAAMGPAARAFHCGAAMGRLLFVFGGHIYVPQHKKLHQFNDMWCLNTVRLSVGLKLLHSPSLFSYPAAAPAAAALALFHAITPAAHLFLAPCIRPCFSFPSKPSASRLQSAWERFLFFSTPCSSFAGHLGVEPHGGVP